MATGSSYYYRSNTIKNVGSSFMDASCRSFRQRPARRSDLATFALNLNQAKSILQDQVSSNCKPSTRPCPWGRPECDNPPVKMPQTGCSIVEARRLPYYMKRVARIGASTTIHTSLKLECLLDDDRSVSALLTPQASGFSKLSRFHI
jgi:hypothetical protein